MNTLLLNRTLCTVGACLLLLGSAGCSEEGATSTVPSETPQSCVKPNPGLVHCQEQRRVSVQFGETEVPDPNQLVGYRVMLSEGSPGVMLLTEDVVYGDGVEVGRAKVSESIVTQPVARRVAIGIKQPERQRQTARCVDVTSIDWNWDNDMLCTRPDGSQFYTSYEGADQYQGY